MNRRCVEMTGAYDGGLSLETSGLMAGTRVASNLGWRAVEALAPGDLVLTFDNGMQEIAEVRRIDVWIDAPDTARACWPVIVPVGALGNRSELTLLADQGVMVECDAACDVHGDPFAVVPAHVLEGVRGIYRAAPRHRVELIVLAFAADQVIYAEGGALLHCPAASATLAAFLDTDAVTYDILGLRDAAFLAQCMVLEDDMCRGVGIDAGQTAMSG